MSIPAPFERYEGEVLPQWIDANGHMNLAYYVVLFDYATDVLFVAIGIGRLYKDATNHGTFVVETHNLYERELLAGERVRVTTQILGTDDKRLQLAHEMFSLASGERAATQELMYLHIDLSARRVVPWPAEVRQRVAAAAAAHRQLQRSIAASGVSFDFGRISVDPREANLRDIGAKTSPEGEQTPIEQKKPTEEKKPKQGSDGCPAQTVTMSGAKCGDDYGAVGEYCYSGTKGWWF